MKETGWREPDFRGMPFGSHITSAFTCTLGGRQWAWDGGTTVKHPPLISGAVGNDPH